MRHELHTEITIEAPPEVVWRTLVDLDAYGGTIVRHSEHFSGVLVRPLRSSIDTAIRAGFEAMNDALKARTEALTGSRS